MHWLTKCGYLTMVLPLFIVPSIGYEKYTYMQIFWLGFWFGVVGQVFIILGRIK